MSPLLPNFIRPMASTAMAASMVPIWGAFTSATLPLKSAWNSSAQLSILRPVSSGL